MDTERNQADLIRHYVKEASSLSGSSLTALIIEATSKPNLFAFSEILSVPAVAELEGTEQSVYVDLLRLFAYGTWSDYKKNAGSLLELDPEQVLKLKQLTVLSVAENRQVLPYDVLMPAIDVSTVRELEDFLIDECIYVGIVKGKLNPLQSCFEVEYAAGRDPRPGQLEKMTDKLSSWLSASDKLLLATQENIKLADTMSELEMKQRKEFEDTVNEQMKLLARERELHESGEKKKQEGMLTRSKRKRLQTRQSDG